MDKFTTEPTYYTPEIEEFHVEFEYEVIEGFDDLKDVVNNPEDHIWIKRSFPCLYAFDGNWGEWVFILEDFIYKKYIRVKHLDRQDIYDLSWADHHIEGIGCFKIGRYILFWFGESFISIDGIYDGGSVSLFRGTIKNFI